MKQSTLSNRAQSIVKQIGATVTLAVCLAVGSIFTCPWLL